MSSHAFVVNGVRRMSAAVDDGSLQVDSLTVSMAAGARTTMNGTIYIPGATWRPTVGQEIAFWSEDRALIGGARTFNGSSSVLSRAFSSGVVDDFTLMAWVYPDSAANLSVPLYIGRDANGYGLRVNGGNWTGYYSGALNLTGAAVVNQAWQHVALRRASGTTQVFVDGEAVGSTSATAPAGAPGGYLSVGARRDAANAGFDSHFTGRIAHVALVHAALTDAQIASIAAGGPSGVGRGVDAVITGTYWYYPIRGLDSPEADTAASTSLTVTSAPATTDGPLVIASDADVLFGGDLDVTDEGGALDQPTDNLMVSIVASDFNGRADWQLHLTDYAADTLDNRLDDILAADGFLLGLNGVAADQATGPSLEASAATGQPLRELLNAITAESDGYIWRIDPFKVLSFRLPSDVAAPFDVDASVVGSSVGDIRVVTSLASDYGNITSPTLGDARTVEKTETFTGNGIFSAVQLSYVLASFWRGTVIINGSSHETVSIDVAGGAWVIDTSLGTVTRAAGALPNGHTMTISYDARFPMSRPLLSDLTGVALYGARRFTLEYPDIFDLAVGDARAAADFARRSTVRKIVTYTTALSGLRPGQIQHIEIPDRDLDDDCVITEVVARAVGPTRLEYQVTASTDGVAASWRDVWQKLAA